MTDQTKLERLKAEMDAAWNAASYAAWEAERAERKADAAWEAERKAESEK